MENDQSPTVTLELWTPDKAREILEYTAAQGFVNRQETKGGTDRGIAAYARMMKNGEWDSTNGETIKIDRSGILVDGHHRLKALIQANVNLELLTARNVSEGAYYTIDRGVSRKLHDHVAQAGIVDRSLASVVTSGAGVLYHYLKTGSRDPASARRTAFSYKDVGSVVDQHPYIIRAAEFYNKYKRKIVISQSNFCLIYTLTYEIDPDKAYIFIERIVDGVGLEIDDARYVLREKLNSLRGGKKRVNYFDELNYVIRAWNAYFKGRKLTRLVLSDELPTIEGYKY